MYAFILNIYLVIDDIISIITIIMTIISCQLPADIPQSSLRTMSKDVSRAMLPNNDEVL